MSKKTCITTPIYYVNDKPHIGHAYTNIACDAIARFNKLNGNDVFFLTGTDEHGQKVQSSAEKNGVEPKEFVDSVCETFKELNNKLNISNDDFIRTSEERHFNSSQKLWETVKKNGYIYKGEYSGWYSQRDEAYYQEDELVDGKAPTGAEVKWIVEESYFFKLSSFQERLLKYIDENPNFIAPKSRLNEVKAFIESGLKDICISRSSFSWGIPVPGEKGHIMYVWFDALSNYITALGHGTEKFDEETFKNTTHIIGKDILRFHAVYWPAFLMAANLPLPKRIFAHGWWTVEGEKMSKSTGNAISPIDLINEYYLDGIRYFLLMEIPFGQDGDFSKSSLKQRLNSDLANSYGNLVQRVCSFVYKNCDKSVPKFNNMSNKDNEIFDLSLKTLDEVIFFMDNEEINKAIKSIWNLISKANQYMDFQAPWKLKKTDEERMKTILYVLLNIIRRIGILTFPFMPNTSERILLQIGEDIKKINNEGFSIYKNMIPVGQEIIEPEVFFKKFD